jgi:WhiB family redox-sensing transcriptional regulator
MVLAACRGMPTDLWFPERGEVAEVAAKVCASCAVQDECLAYGMGERFGIWGGVSEHRRKLIRRRRDRERDARGVTVADELLNGSRHDVMPNDLPATLTQDVAELAGMGQQSSSPAGRSCRGCGTPLDDKRRQWCSDRCRKRKRDRGDVESRTAYTRPTPTATLGLFDLAGLLAAAVPEGVRLSVEVDGVTVTAQRG